jgi:lysophospholipase L1-like esterase
MSGARLLVALAAGLIGLVAVETVFRLFEPRLGIDRERMERLREYVATDGQTLDYQPRPHVLYTRRRGRPGINSLGFADREYPRERSPGVVRIACLGSATTEGDLERRETTYPRQLERVLQERTGGRFEVMNFGVAGWTTAETLIDYVLVVQDFAPDVVIVHEAASDVEPRAWPHFRPDYSHYRRSWTAPCRSSAYRLLLRASDLFAWVESRDPRPLVLESGAVEPLPAGSRFPAALAPDTVSAFRRNVQTIADHVRLRGGRAVLATVPYDLASAAGLAPYGQGIDEHNHVLRELAQVRGDLLVDLDAEVRKQPEAMHASFIDLVRMNPEGERFKADAIATALIAAGYLSR